MPSLYKKQNKKVEVGKGPAVQAVGRRGLETRTIKEINAKNDKHTDSVGVAVLCGFVNVSFCGIIL